MPDKIARIKAGPYFRLGNLVARRADDDDDDMRTFDVVFSSETPVDRFWGKEILDHKRASVDLSRLETGRQPFLRQHDTDQHIGVVESAKVKAREGLATVRLAKTPLAQETLSMMRDGTRPNISVAYTIRRAVLEEEVEGGDDTIRIVDWQPFEISSVAAGADMTAQVLGGDRSNPGDFPDIILERTQAMPPEPVPNPAPAAAPAAAPAPAPAPAAARSATEPSAADMQAVRDRELHRMREITALGTRHQMTTEAELAIKDGTSLENFRGTVLDKIGTTPQVPLATVPADLGLSVREVQSYSLTRAICAMGMGDWTRAPFELECSQEIGKRLGKVPDGFFVPLDWQQFRDPRIDQAAMQNLRAARAAKTVAAQGARAVLDTGTATAAAELVGTDHLGASFIDLLRNSSLVRSLGATILTGLVGDVAIPRQTGAGNVQWVAEETNATVSNLTTDQVALAPSSLIGFQEYTRKLLLQSAPSVDQLVREDLAMVMGIEIDRVVIEGSGSGAEPLGIINLGGLAIVALGTNGAAVTWADVVALEQNVDSSNALLGNMSYLGNANVKAKLKTVEKAASTAQFLLDRDGQLNGMNAAFSNNVPSDLTKGTGTALSALILGNWRDAIIAEWGTVDVIVNPFALDVQRSVRVSIAMETDVNFRHIESFSAIVDMDTT